MADLRRLGVAGGATLMTHTRMSAIGRVDGADTTVVASLLEALEPGGTLMAYVAWEDRAGAVYDPSESPAWSEVGRVPERIRTWSGAERSDHPDASVAAVGPRARELTADHPQRDAYGAQSPFGRLVDAAGQVLLLGAPLDTITLLHHAEAIARAPGKRMTTIRVRTPEGEQRFTEIDTENGVYDYRRLGLEVGEFEAIARDALAAGIGRRGMVGEAESHLFPARELVEFGVAWLEERFGP